MDESWQNDMSLDSRLPNFRSLVPAQRLRVLAEAGFLSAAELELLSKPGALPSAAADGMIENVIGTFELPLAVASNFRINGKDVVVPMVVEEPSIVAAASFMAKLVRESGGFFTSSTLPLMRAQIQLVGVADPYGARQAILRARSELIEVANGRDKVLIGLGGGWRRHGRQHCEHHGRGGGDEDRRSHRRIGPPSHPLQPGRPASRPGESACIARGARNV
jgi:hydroxymethylglutaryl-CoA reductase